MGKGPISRRTRLSFQADLGRRGGQASFVSKDASGCRRLGRTLEESCRNARRPDNRKAKRCNRRCAHWAFWYTQRRLTRDQPLSIGPLSLNMAELHLDKFGGCCKDLADAMIVPPKPFFRVEENGVLYLTIGYVPTDRGSGFYDQAVIFCPFCGKQLQTKEQIKAAVNASREHGEESTAGPPEPAVSASELADHLRAAAKKPTFWQRLRGGG